MLNMIHQWTSNLVKFLGPERFGSLCYCNAVMNSCMGIPSVLELLSAPSGYLIIILRERFLNIFKNSASLIYCELHVFSCRNVHIFDFFQKKFLECYGVICYKVEIFTLCELFEIGRILNSKMHTA